MKTTLTLFSQAKKMAMINEELEKLITIRTQQLVKVNEELESFNYSVSHDLRAPLRGIAGLGELILKDYQHQLDDKGKHYLKLIIDSADEVKELIKGLLDLSQMGKVKLERTDVDMNAVVDSVLNILIESNQDLVLDIDVKPLPHAIGDKLILRQVYMNLLTNALKFSSRRKISKIEVGSLYYNDTHTYYVKDNGIGFDSKYAEKIFKTFNRLHTQDEFEGTGVGLAIIKRIVERHGGRVWAEGKINEGATFYFTLGRDIELINDNLA